jgi:hypothetical protein
MNTYNAAQLAGIYIKMRVQIRELEDKVKAIKHEQLMVTDKMLELCSDQDVNSLATTNGTISRRLSSSYWTGDWDSFYSFVKDNDAYHLLEKRIHNTNMKEFLADNPDAVPMGLQAKRQYVISVRKPKPKVGDDNE